MRVQGFLVIKKTESNYGRIHYALRINKEKPKLSADEIAVLLNIDIPQEFFDRLIPVVDIKLPKEAVITPGIETTVMITADEIAKKLQLNVEDVIDGLHELLQKKKQEGTEIQEA